MKNKISSFRLQPSSFSRITLILSLITLFPLLLWGFPQIVQGASTGVSGHTGADTFDCSRCHGGGFVPTATVAGPQTVLPSQRVSYLLDIESGFPAFQNQAGMGVTVRDDGNVKAGVLTYTAGANLQILDGELAQSGSVSADSNGLATFAFDWIAPAASGTYTLYYAANSVNGNGQPSFDGVTTGVFTVTVEGATTAVSVRDIGADSIGGFKIVGIVAVLLVMTIFVIQKNRTRITRTNTD